MRRRLKNFRNKNGHSENGAPRQLVDEAHYREHWRLYSNGANGIQPQQHYDTGFSGISNGSRPRDSSISLRSKPAYNNIG